MVVKFIPLDLNNAASVEEERAILKKAMIQLLNTSGNLITKAVYVVGSIKEFLLKFQLFKHTES